MKHIVFILATLLIILCVPYAQSTVKAYEKEKIVLPPTLTPLIIITPAPSTLKKLNYQPQGINAQAKEMVMRLARQMFGEDNLEALDQIMVHEAHYNPHAMNQSSGACGMFQALPCEKMGCSLDDIECQTRWGLTYIQRRYGNANKAWSFWQVNHYY